MTELNKPRRHFNRTQLDGLARVLDMWAGGSSIAFVSYLTGHLSLTPLESNGLIIAFFASIISALILRGD
ncbi:MAG: hypothetical protein QM537_03835 [Candidatus Symbiobacter sp.]|nr:hypothetical protein [Candidatus Symbiobacter sp.]